jgi:hypothetical protein
VEILPSQEDSMKARSLLTTLSLATAGLGAVACSSGSADSHASVEQTGTIEAALTAVGPDGATYALSSSAFLQLSWRNDGGAQTQLLYFNSTSPSQSFDVAPATYSATLFNTTTLTRIADSGPTTVSAILADTQPYTFTVTAGQTTDLTFHYTIAGIGDVTFSTGTLNTHLQVDASTASAGHVLASGTASVGWRTNGPPALNAALAASGPVSVSYSVSATLTSGFAPATESSCANITGTITATADTMGNDQNFAALYNEASGGTGTVCFYDANSSILPGQMSILFFRTGAPQTMQMLSVLGPSGQMGEEFGVEILGTPATPFYDGSTLHLSELDQPLTIPAAQVEAIYEPNFTVLDTNNVGSVTVQVTP